MIALFAAFRLLLIFCLQTRSFQKLFFEKSPICSASKGATDTTSCVSRKAMHCSAHPGRALLTSSSASMTLLRMHGRPVVYSASGGLAFFGLGAISRASRRRKAQSKANQDEPRFAPKGVLTLKKLPRFTNVAALSRRRAVRASCHLLAYWLGSDGIF